MLGVYGAGGLGRELYDLALRVNSLLNRWDRIVFIDDDLRGDAKKNLPIYSFEEFKLLPGKLEIVVGVGEPSVRNLLHDKVISHGLTLATLVDPTALVSNSAVLEPGVIISEFCSIHSQVNIGINTLIQPYCCIGHDIRIGKHSVISTTVNIGGGTVIGDRVYLGMNCAILQELTIENESIIANGSCCLSQYFFWQYCCWQSRQSYQGQ